MLSSCLSTKELIKGDSLLENDIHVLNGMYKNVAVNVDNPKSEQSLYLLLFKNYHRQMPSYNKDKDYEGNIKIEVLSDKKIRVDHIVNGCIKKSRTYKGRIKNDFFVIKRKWIIIGVPPVLGGYDESKLAIGISKDGYLYIKKGFFNIAGIVGMANSNEFYYDYFYEKIDIPENENEIYKEVK